MSINADKLRSALGLEAAKVTAVAGPNFSGRTRILRAATNLADHIDPTPVVPALSGAPAAYIGPEISNCISGLASTVRGELKLNSGGDIEDSPAYLLVNEFALDRFYDRNPFTLSGGEQACLAISSALALQPEVLAIDCALEQLDRKMKPFVTGLLASGKATAGTAVVVADNRLDECALPVTPVEAATIDMPPMNLGSAFPKIDPSIRIPEVGSFSGTLELADITFAYPKSSPVLEGLSMRFEPGKPYFILGHNGAGKSTLAKLMAGVIRANSGSMVRGGEPFDPYRQPGQAVTYHFQNPDLQLFATTVEEEVTEVARMKRAKFPGLADRADAVISAFGLDTVRSEHPLDLPFVLRKRIALAATVAAGSNWVILDEPTLGQDREASESLGAIIDGLLSTGLGVLIITHSDTFLEILPGERLVLKDRSLKSSC